MILTISFLGGLGEQMTYNANEHVFPTNVSVTALRDHRQKAMLHNTR